MTGIGERAIILFRVIMLFLAPVAVYSISLLPSLYVFVLFIKLVDLKNVLHLLLSPFAVFLLFLFTLFSIVVIPGFFAWILKRKLSEGEYEISLSDRTVFRYMLYCILYRNPLKILNIVNFLPLRYILLRLAGLKMGKGCKILGNELIEDPFATEIGDNTLIGGYSIITAHVIENKLTIKRIKIGSNCIIGGDVFIMPGAVIEDNVIVAAKSLVPKNKLLKRNTIYGGVPVKEIGTRK